MVALARARRDFHLAKQRVHLGDGQHAPCPDRAVAGDGRGDEVELVAQRERTTELGDFARKVGQQARAIGLAERGRLMAGLLATLN